MQTTKRSLHDQSSKKEQKKYNPCTSNQENLIGSLLDVEKLVWLWNHEIQRISMESNCLSRVTAGYGVTNLGIGAETNGKKGDPSDGLRPIDAPAPPSCQQGLRRSKPT